MKNNKPVIYLATTTKSPSLEFGSVDSNEGGEKENETRNSDINIKSSGTKSII